MAHVHLIDGVEPESPIDAREVGVAVEPQEIALLGPGQARRVVD